MTTMNRVILHGFVMTEPVRVSDVDRIRFAFRVPRPPGLPRKRGRHGNADHVLVEAPPDVEVHVGQAYLCEGRLESRDTREARTVVAAERLAALGDPPGLNAVWVGGFLTDDALLFTTRSGRLKVVCRMAVVRPKALRQDGRDVDFVSVEAYGLSDQNLIDRLVRGAQVIARGYVQSKDERGDPDIGWPLSVVAIELIPTHPPQRQEEESLDKLVARFLHKLSQEEQM